MRLLFVGATRNYFKLGHTTISYIASHYPNIKIRLTIPEVKNAKAACEGMNVELVEWDPNDGESIKNAFENCDAALLVHPIKDRIRMAQVYLEAAKNSDIKFIVCIGVQHDDPLVRLASDAHIVDLMLLNSGIPFCTLKLPMFLENLLYQAESIKTQDQFYYPCNAESKFSYISCSDLAPIVAYMLINRVSYQDTKWTARNQTSCAELAQHFTKIFGRKISFLRISDREFLQSLLQDDDSDSSKDAANGILQLWKEIDANHDLPSSDLFARSIRKEPMTSFQWIKEHKCCFSVHRTSCIHPQPPKKQALQLRQKQLNHY